MDLFALRVLSGYMPRNRIAESYGGSLFTFFFFAEPSHWASLVAQDSKASAYNVGDLGSIPRLGRSPGEGNGNPLHYSRLENAMDRGAWWATVHGVAESRT